MLLSVEIGSPQFVSDERWWNCISIINKANTKGQAHSEPPAWLAIDLPLASLQMCSQQHELLRQSGNLTSSWPSNHRTWERHLFWFKLMLLFFFLNAEIVIFYQHCGQQGEKGKRGWLRGSGWMGTRWDTGTADGQIFTPQSLHRVAGGSLGDGHLLFNLTWSAGISYIFGFIESSSTPSRVV